MASTAMPNQPPEPITNDRWLRITEVMRATSLSRTTIYGLMDTGKLKSVKVGGARRVAASALAEFMSSFND